MDWAQMVEKTEKAKFREILACHTAGPPKAQGPNAVNLAPPGRQESPALRDGRRDDRRTSPAPKAKPPPLPNRYRLSRRETSRMQGPGPI